MLQVVGKQKQTLRVQVFREWIIRPGPQQTPSGPRAEIRSEVPQGFEGTWGSNRSLNWRACAGLRGGRPQGPARPLTAPSGSALPARPVPSLRPPHRPGGRNPSGRARGQRAYTDRLAEATNSPRGATAASSKCLSRTRQKRQHPFWKPSPTWRRQPPPPPHLPGMGRWPRAPNRSHSFQRTNYRARRDRLAAPASPFRLGARARRPRPPGARAGARGTLGAGVFQPFPGGTEQQVLTDRGGRAGLWATSSCCLTPGSLHAGPFPIPAAPFQQMRRSMNVRSTLIFFALRSVIPIDSVCKYKENPTAFPASSSLVGCPHQLCLDYWNTLQNTLVSTSLLLVQHNNELDLVEM